MKKAIKHIILVLVFIIFTVMATEGMTEIEIYMDRDAAAMAGVPVD